MSEHTEPIENSPRPDPAADPSEASPTRRIAALSKSDPRSIGPYRLLGRLGSGGMGRIYLGESHIGKQVAIKVIRSELADDEVFRRRFEREVSIARSVNALYTAPVVEADPDADPPWFAAAYIDGPSLESLVMERGPLASQVVFTLAAGLAEALAGMHKAGLIHRDLKPANILLNDNGPHVIDFGISLPANATRLTSSLVLGTPGFLAPERIEGDEGTAAGDIFALGASLVFAATGHPIVKDNNLAAQLAQLVRGKLDLTGLPNDLRPLVVRCLARRPKDRPTAEEIVRMLVAYGVAKPGPGWFGAAWPHGSTSGGSVGRVPASRRRFLAYASAAGLGIVGMGSAWLGGLRWPALTGSVPDGDSSVAASPGVGGAHTGGATPNAGGPHGGGAKGPGSPAWRANVAGSPMVANSEVIVLHSADGLAAISADSGAVRWRYSTAFATDSGHLWGEQLLFNTGGVDGYQLMAVSVRDGRQLYSVPAVGAVMCYTEIEPGVIGIVTFDGVIWHLSATGEVLAKSRSFGSITSAAATPTVAVLGSWSSRGQQGATEVKAVSLATHSPIWTRTLPRAPAAVPGEPPEVATTPSVAFAISNHWAGMYRITDGTLLGQRPIGGNLAYRVVGHTASGSVILAEYARSQGQFGVAANGTAIVAWTASGARQVWRTPAYGLTTAALSEDGRSCCVSTSGHLHHIDTDNGRTVWSVPLPEVIAYSLPQWLSVHGDVVYLYVRPSGAEREPLAANLYAISLH